MDNTSLLAGFPVMPIDKARLDEYTNACIAQGVGYGLGDKDPVLGTFPPDFHFIDCSGFVRTLIYFATHGATRIPDGSWIQDDWLDKAGYKKSDYASSCLEDQVVRVCLYRNPSGVGHAWITYNGRTYESHGSKGVDHRDPKSPLFARITTHVYAVA